MQTNFEWEGVRGLLIECGGSGDFLMGGSIQMNLMGIPAICLCGKKISWDFGWEGLRRICFGRGWNYGDFSVGGGSADF